jgi:transposase
MHRVERLSIREIGRRTVLHRKTIRRALVSPTPPRYSRPAAPSKLDPVKDWICEQLRADPTIQSLRLREMAAELGYEGGKTIFDDFVREVRPRFQVRRTFQRTVYRPGELVQCDLWEPREWVPVGHGQTRRGWVVTAELCWSRVIAGALVFSKEAPDILWGVGRCLSRIGALPEKLVWDREGAIHAGGGRPTDAFAGFCGQLGIGWVILDAGDAQAKGVLERSHRFMRTNFEPGRRFANPLEFQNQLDGWCEAVNRRVHRTIRAVPAERLAEEQGGCGRCLAQCLTATAAGLFAFRSSPICGSIATTTRSTRRSPGAASRSASRRPSSWRSCSTAASSRAVTGGRSPAGSRSPTPHTRRSLSASARDVASVTTSRSRSGRWPTTTR